MTVQTVIHTIAYSDSFDDVRPLLVERAANVPAR